jgi:hypothetical protein
MRLCKWLWIVAAVAVTASLSVAGPAVAAKGGNNDAAKRCQKGGWASVFDATGGRFVNQGDCVNDGAQGLGVFNTAGEAACTQIHGTFDFVNNEAELWECRYQVPPNPSAPPQLVPACITDTFGMGGVINIHESGDTWVAECTLP